MVNIWELSHTSPFNNYWRRIFHSLLQILTPFGIFIITEELLHASGVIAVVVAGIVHSLVKEKTEIRIAEEQVLTK